MGQSAWRARKRAATEVNSAGVWLSDMDSNHDKGLQRALCYRYTIGQTAVET